MEQIWLTKFSMGHVTTSSKNLYWTQYGHFNTSANPKLRPNRQFSGSRRGQLPHRTYEEIEAKSRHNPDRKWGKRYKNSRKDNNASRKSDRWTRCAMQKLPRRVQKIFRLFNEQIPNLVIMNISRWRQDQILALSPPLELGVVNARAYLHRMVQSALQKIFLRDNA